MRAAIEGLCESAFHDPVAPAAGADLRRMRTGHHIVYFQIDGAGVDVIRILHERMDAGTRIKE